MTTSKTVLVTGGAGFIGRPLCRALLERGHSVVCADRESAVNGFAEEWADSRPAPHFRSFDISDAKGVRELIAEVRPSVVIHSAAIVGVAASVNAGLASAVDVNIRGSVNLFDAIIEVGGVERIIDLSSEETYGDFQEDPASETTLGRPVSPYGITKFAVERFGNHYADAVGLPYVAARLSWVYGPNFPRTRLPQPWLDDIASGVDSVLPRGGDQLVDFTHIDDVLAGLQLLIEAPRATDRAYNISSGQAVTIRELRDVLSVVAPDWGCELGPGLLELAPGVPGCVKGAYDLSRMREQFGFEPSVGLEDGLQRTLTDTRERLATAHDAKEAG